MLRGELQRCYVARCWAGCCNSKNQQRPHSVSLPSLGALASSLTYLNLVRCC
jgi:hypothetical protein